MNKFNNYKGMAMLYVIVTVGVLALAFTSITEIGKSRALQATTAQSKSKAYEALDSMMECAMGLDRSQDSPFSISSSPLPCGASTLYYTSGTSASTKDYDMLVGRFSTTTSSCAQAIFYHIDDKDQVPALTDGYRVRLFVRGFSSCKIVSGGVVPQVKDPSFVTVTEVIDYKDFAPGTRGY